MKKISIISTTYNAEKTIERMIVSVIHQTAFNDIEFIIIDGNSTDTTVNIIKKYERYITYWISENDQGVYSAMNKGVSVASGEYIYFLGADDWLFEDHTIEKVLGVLASNMDLYCGCVNLYDPKLRLYKKIKPISTTDKDIIEMVPHQGVFSRKELVTFDDNYKVAADYKFYLSMVIGGKKIAYLDNIIANYSICGISAIEKERRHFEYYRAINEVRGESYAEMYRNGIAIKREYIKEFIKSKIIFSWMKRLMLYINGWHK